MRALALSALALLATAASAQDLRGIPGHPPAGPPATLDEGCIAPLSPAARAAHEADARAYSDDGPAPVPMPNWCAEPAPLAVAPMDGEALDYLRRNVRPPTYWLEEGQPLPPPYLDRLRQRYDRFEALPSPDLPFPGGPGLLPVAPREDRP